MVGQVSMWAIVSKWLGVLSLHQHVIKIILKSNMGPINLGIWNVDILHYTLGWRMSHLSLEQGVLGDASYPFPIVGHIHVEISPVGLLHLQ